jgi:hypothetical protein
LYTAAGGVAWSASKPMQGRVTVTAVAGLISEMILLHARLFLLLVFAFVLTAHACRFCGMRINSA